MVCLWRCSDGVRLVAGWFAGINYDCWYPVGESLFCDWSVCFFPFGKEAISRKDLYLKEDIGTGPFGLVGNVIWFLFAGIWLAFGHICSAIACFVTIIGIPFAIQHLKLAGIALAPIGMTIVPKELAAAVRGQSAAAELNNRRSR